MGCNCCKDSKEDYQSDTASIKQVENKLFAVVNGVNVQIKKADILKEQVDSFVIGTDIYLKNFNHIKLHEQERKFLQELLKDHVENNNNNQEDTESQFHTKKVLPYGEALQLALPKALPNKNQSIKSIIAVSLPLYRGGEQNELGILENGIKHSLQQSEQNAIESIAITDIASCIFGYPKQDFADITIKALNHYLTEKKSDNSNLQNVFIILRDDRTIRLFEKSLHKYMNIQGSISELSAYEDGVIQGRANKGKKGNNKSSPLKKNNSSINDGKRMSFNIKDTAEMYQGEQSQEQIIKQKLLSEGQDEQETLDTTQQ